MKKIQIQHSLLLLLTAVIWGTAFVAQSVGMDYVGPFTFLCTRSFIGGAALLPVIAFMDRQKSEEARLEEKKPENRKVLIRGGILCGLALCFASVFQQYGILFTTVGKAGFITACSIVLAVAGVALLSIGGDSSRPVTLLGVGMMLLSGFCNALYITGIHVAGIRNMNGLVMTFYVLFFGAAFAFANAVGTGTFQPLSSWWEFMMAALLAVITAVLSNLTLVLAVQRIGSTLTSVLGVMEPLTAVFVGILVFNEPFTPALVGGVILISSSVTLVMLGRQVQAIARRFQRKAA